MPDITETMERTPSPVYILDPHNNRTRDEDIDLSHTTGKLPTWHDAKESLGTRQGWFGDYDYSFLCMPTLPGFTIPRDPPFFGLKDRLPLLLAVVMGFQHALAMIAGVVTPAIIMSGPGSNGLNFTAENRSQMISTSLITSGLLSLIQITRFRLGKTRYYMGTGLLSVVGTSFIYLPVLQSSVSNMYASGFCKSSIDESGSAIYEPCPDAWGAFLGTCMVCSILPMILSFIPPRALKRIFPPIVTGVTVTLIGVSLVTSGMQQWGGGSGPCASRPTSGPFVDCPMVGAPNAAPWGDARWIGLGFLVFSIINLVEFFGSPFMKNAQVVIGLIAGLIVAVACGYTTSDSIKAAPAATFLWTTTYKLSIYAPAVIPLLISYVLVRDIPCCAMVESIGDITASCEVSKLSVEGREFESRLQAGIFADGVNGLLAPLMMNSPMSCYAQNNGIISLTRCANTMAGYMCCLFLILMGIFSKFGAVFLTIPDPVLGGMTTFLFASVVVSGIRILSFLSWTRRDRFIVAASLSLGLGASLVPGVLTHMINYQGSSSVVSSLVTSVNIILDTGFALGAIVSCILNALLSEIKEPTVEKAVNEMEVEAQSIHAHKTFPWIISGHLSARAPPLEKALNIQAMVRLWDYPIEEHLVRTKDSYLLGIHRIPHGRESNTKRGEPRPPSNIVDLLHEIGVPLASEINESSLKAMVHQNQEQSSINNTDKRKPAIKPVVLLYHGFMMSSEVWVCNLDEERNLAFVLAEAGYDVWLGNSRGNKYSLKHMFIRPEENRFWKFSMDELALFDLPDTYILKRTGAPSLVYIGFSQGTAQAFASLSINPDLNQKISLFIAMAPATTPPGLDNGLVNAVVKAAPNIIYLLLGRKTPLSVAIFWQNILHPSIYAALIQFAVRFLFGWEGQEISHVQKSVSYQHLYSFTSVRILVHWFQIIRTQVFQMYDDIPTGVPYLSSRRGHCPHPFPTRQIATPIAIFFGGKDSLVNAQGLVSDLPELVGLWEVPEYEHLDFLWAQCVHQRVFPQILDLLGKYSVNGHVSSKTPMGVGIKQMISNIKFKNGNNEGNTDDEIKESPLKTPKDSPIADSHVFEPHRSTW
ncbi:hypothetical protein BGZ76_009729 [Entomortierella beljakovae]|nr:hypothetical protein BGZ76_009729 [Entomortierella beljakovae]